jgi:hypothetical protein
VIRRACRAISAWSPGAELLKREGFWEAVAWVAFGVVAVPLGWASLVSVVFAVSIWANVRTAFTGWQAARAELAAGADDDRLIAEWRERALVAEGQVRELRHSVGELIDTTVRTDVARALYRREGP